MGRATPNRDFLLLWGGETVSLFGSEVTGLALPLVAVLVLNATPAQLGVLNACRFAPFLLLSLPAGVWIDRLRRLPVLLVANVASAFVLGLVPLLAATGLLSVAYLAMIAFGVTLVVSFVVLFRVFLAPADEDDDR